MVYGKVHYYHQKYLSFIRIICDYGVANNNTFNHVEFSFVLGNHKIIILFSSAYLKKNYTLYELLYSGHFYKNRNTKL